MNLRLALVGALLLAGCGGGGFEGGAATACVKGATQECACPGGAMGAQACLDDQSGWAGCQCAAGGGAGGGTSDAGGDAPAQPHVDWTVKCTDATGLLPAGAANCAWSTDSGVLVQKVCEINDLPSLCERRSPNGPRPNYLSTQALCGTDQNWLICNL